MLLSAENKGQFGLHAPANQAPQQPTSRTAADPHRSASERDNTRPSEPSDNALGFMLASVADDYQQSIRYPDYSVPLSAAQAEAYQGNRYHPVGLPLEDDGLFTVSLEKFRFTRGETILVVASLSGRQVFGNTLSADLETADDQKPATSTVLKATESAGYFEGTLNSDYEPGEYRLIVEAKVDGRPVRHASSLTIEPDLGDFEGLGTPYIILVHGFMMDDLSNPPANFEEVQQAGAANWQDYWLNRSEARIDWGSNGRVEGEIAQQAYQQLRQISQHGLCNNYCIMVTHSTGDLVTRHLLENQARWLQADGLQPLKILAVMDLAGAGGGTELADLAVSVAYNDSWYNWPVKAAVKAFTGIDPQPGKLGVVNDLQTNVARNLAVNPNAIPGSGL